MQKKVITIVMSAILVLSLAACGTTTATTPEPVDPQPTAEVETPVVEEVESTPEPEPEPEVEEVTETEETEVVEETEVPEETETETETEEIDPMEALLNSDMGEYISGGVFDVEGFANDTNSSFWAIGPHSFILVYDDAWFIQAGEEDLHPGTSFVVIGKWDKTNTERGNSCTFSYVFPSSNDISVGEIIVPVECIIHLKDIYSFTSGNGPDVAPDVPKTNFRPCDPVDSTVQY